MGAVSIGYKIGHITVIGESINKRKVVCRCDCGKTFEAYKSNLSSGRTKSCGCHMFDTTNKKSSEKWLGKTFGHWTVIEVCKGSNKVVCQCDCENKTIREVFKSSLANGRSQSCGCAKSDKLKNINTPKGREKLIGKQFNRWTVIGLSEDYDKVVCQCSCAKHTIKEIYVSHLRSGHTKSCGCMRHEEIVDYDTKRAQLIKFIQERYCGKPTCKQLAKDTNLGYTTILAYIKKYNITEYVHLMNGDSHAENELFQFVEGISNQNNKGDKLEVIRHDHKLIYPNELDLYIPSRKIAIEFNGTYWHSEAIKGKDYHLNKTKRAYEKNVRLIHIFEHEWVNQTDIVKGLIEIVLGCQKHIVYARNTSVVEISAKDAAEFLNKNHFQGNANSPIRLGIIDENGEILEVMTFGSDRFNSYQYELVRLCSKIGYSVAGGASKLFNYFLKKYNPTSIISYCDISKFDGSVYKKLGMSFRGLTLPGYCWVNIRTFEVVKRYNSTKQKLVKNGLGTIDETEDSIMTRNNFVKIYNCGNARFVWTVG